MPWALAPQVPCAKKENSKGEGAGKSTRGTARQRRHGQDERLCRGHDQDDAGGVLRPSRAGAVRHCLLPFQERLRESGSAAERCQTEERPPSAGAPLPRQHGP
eukprot:scaffold500553_cov29-Prasinocladus_malaysianus.AAC.1